MAQSRLHLDLGIIRRYSVDMRHYITTLLLLLTLGVNAAAPLWNNGVVLGDAISSYDRLINRGSALSVKQLRSRLIKQSLTKLELFRCKLNFNKNRGVDLFSYRSEPKVISINTENGIAPKRGFSTWNEFQAGTKGQFASRLEASQAWHAYKQANGIVTGTTRSMAQRSAYLKQLYQSGKAPKWMNQYLSKGKVPKGYHVDHIRALFDGGADLPSNMRLKLIKDHITRHRFYRP